MDNDWRNKTLAGVDYSSTSAQSPLNSNVTQHYDYETGQLNGVRANRNPLGMFLHAISKITELMGAVALFCAIILPKMNLELPEELGNTPIAARIINGDTTIAAILYGISLMTFIGAIFTHGVDRVWRKLVKMAAIPVIIIAVSMFLK